MTQDDLGARVRAIISDHIASHGLEPKEITDDSTMVDLGLDSLDRIDITMCIEDEFDLELSDSEVEQLHSVGQFIRHLASALNLVEAAA